MMTHDCPRCGRPVVAEAKTETYGERTMRRVWCVDNDNARDDDVRCWYEAWEVVSG